MEKARVKRQEYLQQLAKKKEALDLEVKQLQEQGLSLKEIAKMKVEQRNKDRINSYKNNPEGLQKMKERNLKEYGREEGPTYEQILEKEGGSDIDVIYSTTKTSEGFNIILGLDNE